MQHRPGRDETPDRLSARLKARHYRGAGPNVALDVASLADFIAACATADETLIVGVTGSVASGKTTLCTQIANGLRPARQVEMISTDGFLLPNDVLASRNLMLRKGFPESYDCGLMSGVLQRVRHGAVHIPGYSHTLYDRAPELDRTINKPDILLVEGLGLLPHPGQRNAASLVDILIYIDAAEEDLETWFLRRFMAFWRDAETNSASFYARFRSMSEPDAETFARSVWNGINLPNLRDHISQARAHADIVLRKSREHELHVQGPHSPAIGAPGAPDDHTY